jgi:hypothetical protein
MTWKSASVRNSTRSIGPKKYLSILAFFDAEDVGVRLLPRPINRFRRRNTLGTRRPKGRFDGDWLSLLNTNRTKESESVLSTRCKRYVSLTPTQQALYDAVVTPALRKRAEEIEGKRIGVAAWLSASGHQLFWTWDTRPPCPECHASDGLRTR